MSDNDQRKSKVQIGTVALSILGLINVACAYGLASLFDHFFDTHCWEHVILALIPSTHALMIGLLLTPVFLVLSEVIPFVRERLLHLPSETPNDFAKPTSNFGYIIRALVTGAPEEVLIRGVVQGIAGLWVASAIFAALHISSKKALPYAASTFIYGLFFGAVYACTSNLWVTIVIHVINNFLGFHPLVRRQMDKLLPTLPGSSR